MITALYILKVFLSEQLAVKSMSHATTYLLIYGILETATLTTFHAMTPKVSEHC